MQDQFLSFRSPVFPIVAPKRMTGELTYKIILHDYLRADGRKKLYLLCIQNRRKRRLSLDIMVPENLWDAELQQLIGNTREIKDLNLLITQKKALANEIMIRYRLSGRKPLLDDFCELFLNPIPQTDFLSYMDMVIDQRKPALATGTYRHHKATVTKLRAYKDMILFSELNLKLINDLKNWMIKQRGNNPNTVNSTLKLIKTYLNHARHIDGIKLDFEPRLIKLPNYSGQLAYLTLDEVQLLERYYHSDFCPKNYRQVLQVFLFGCYTGLRYTDLARVARTNLVDGRLIIVPHKTRRTGKFVSLKLSEKAKSFLNEEGPLFSHVYTNQSGNRFLKEIAKACGITKPLSWHVARHTFATAFLTLGGRLEVLQQLLGHAKISETQIYGKIIDQSKDAGMELFDGI